MASIAVLPVLIGLAVDYAIQFHARFDEQRARTARTVRAPRPRRRPRRAGRRSSPPAWPPRSASSCCCCRRSRWCAASACCSCSGSRSRWPARSARASPRWCASASARRAGPARAAAPARSARGARRRIRAWPGPREWVADRAWRALGVALARPGRVLAIGLASPWPGSRSTPRARWSRTCASSCRSDLQALKDVNALQEETGVSGEIDVTVRADDITDAEGDRLDDPLPATACCARTATGPASAAPRSATRRSCARRSRCPTCSARRARARDRCASC